MADELENGTEEQAVDYTKEVGDLLGGMGPEPGSKVGGEPPGGEEPPEVPPREGAPPAEEPPAETPPAEPPVEEPPAEEPPPGEPPAEQPPAEAPPAETPPAEDPERAALLAQNEALQKQIYELSAALGKPPEMPREKPPGEGEQPPGTPAQPAKSAELETITFVEDEAGFDKVLNSAEEFNKMMTGVVGRTVEAVYTTMPAMVTNMVTQQVEQRLAINEFYRHNEDLSSKEMRPYVAFVANQLASQNPEWDFGKVLEELGKEVRTKLQLKESAGTGAPPAPSTPPAPPGGGTGDTPPGAPQGGTEQGPAFAPGSGARGGPAGPGLTKLEKEISDTIDFQ